MLSLHYYPTHYVLMQFGFLAVVEAEAYSQN